MPVINNLVQLFLNLQVIKGWSTIINFKDRAVIN